MKKLMILVGNIGSGKTSSIADLVKLGYNIIARDAFRYMLGGGKYVFESITEKIIKKIATSMFRQMVQKKLDIVIDATNMSIASREEMLRVANKAGYTTIAYIMPKLSKRKSIERRMTNSHGDFSKKVWSSVWDRFNESYEVPTHEEGFDKIIHAITRDEK